MLLFVVAFTAVSVRDSRDDAISSLVRDAGKGVGESRPATGSARRQLLYSGVTFYVFSAYTGSTKWSVWLGREEPDEWLTGYAEISPAAGISYGSGSTSTNHATFENSYLALKGEPSGDCDYHVEVFGGGAPPWATAQNDDHFGVLLEDYTGDSACSLVVIASNKLSSATHCGAMFMYAAEIDPAAAAGKGVKTYMRHAQTCELFYTDYALGPDGIDTEIMAERTACGASHAYEFITLKEADAFTYESDWDAAVSKSIHPKITMSLAPNTSPLFVLYGKYNDPISIYLHITGTGSPATALCSALPVNSAFFSSRGARGCTLCCTADTRQRRPPAAAPQPARSARPQADRRAPPPPAPPRGAFA